MVENGEMSMKNEIKDMDMIVTIKMQIDNLTKIELIYQTLNWEHRFTREESHIKHMNGYRTMLQHMYDRLTDSAYTNPRNEVKV